jgi:DNA repair exonuclease SbcCD ATPase subunit
MSELLASRIYDLRISNYEDSIKKVRALTAAFNKLDATKKKLNEQLQQRIEAGDSSAVDALRARLAELEKQLAAVSKRKNEAAKESDGLAKAQGRELSATEAYAKAELDAIKQVKDSTKYTTALASEKDKAAKASERQAAANRVEAGSYFDIVNQLKQLGPLIRSANAGSAISFGGNNLSFDQAIAKFKELSLVEQSFRRQFQADGTLVSEYSSGIINAFNKLGLGDIISKNRQQLQSELARLRTETQELATQLSSAALRGSEGFANLEQRVRENITIQEQYERQLQTINTTLAQSGSIGQRITGAIGKGFSDVRGQIKSTIGMYVGFFAAINEGQKLIHQAAELSDQMNTLRIYIHGTKEETQSLIDTLKKIDTRTSLAGLVDIATAVAQKGVKKENIGGVTQAFDQLFTAMSGAGKSADVHESVLTIAKLISIFHEDHDVTPVRVRELGNAMFSLQSSGPVSNEFLQGFSERVGAVRSITGATIPQILGMGAAFQQLGQTEEVAGSASSILLTKMISNIDKFSKIAGISSEKLRELIKLNPFEGLLAVAEGIKAKGAGGVEELVKLVGDLGVNAVRTRGAFSELINNSELFRQKMTQAGAAINDTSGSLEAFKEKQEGFGAALDRIRNIFINASANEGFLKLLNNITTALGFFIKLLFSIPFGLVVTGVTLATAAWAFYKGNILATTIAQSANNEATLLGTLRRLAERLGLLENTAAKTANIVATEGLTVATEGAAVATKELNVAAKASPLGLVLGLIGLLVPLVSVFANTTDKATEKMNAQNKALKDTAEIMGDVKRQVASDTASISAKITELVGIIKDENNSLFLRKKAYDELISIAPDFTGVLKDEKFDLDQLAASYITVIDNLKKLSEAKAISSIRDKYAQDKAQKEADAFEAKLKADAEAKDNARIRKENEDIKTLKGVTGGSTTLVSTNYTTQSEADAAKKDYENKLAAAKDAASKSDALDAFIKNDVQNRQKNIKDLQAQLAKLKAGTDEYNKKKNEIEKAQKNLTVVVGADGTGGGGAVTSNGTGGGGTKTLSDLQSQLSDINSQIAALDKIKTLTEEQKTKLKQLRLDKAEVLREIKEMNGGGGTNRGSQLSLGDKEQFKDIDAQRDEGIASERLKRAQNITDEETYLKTVLRINQEAIDKKLALLNGSNAQERKVISELKLDRITQEQETNTKIFEERKKVLKSVLDEQVRDLQASNRLVQEDVTVFFSDKADRQQETDKKILDLTQKYGVDILALEKQFGHQSIENQKEVADAIREIKENLRKDEKATAEAQLKDAEDAAEKDISDFKKNVEAQRLAIVTSSKPQRKKDVALENLQKEEDFGVLVREVARNTIEKEIYEKLLKAKVITQQQYNTFLESSYKKEQELHDAGVKNTEKATENITTLGQLIQTRLSSIFGFDNGTTAGKAREKLLAETIAQSYALAQNAMNAFYDQERANIDRSKQVIEKRIDLEKDQRLAQATSEAERQQIEKEAQIKKDKADRDAFEKTKKIQRAQALMNLGIQLSNLAVIAFAPNPANIATLGVAGAIMYGLQAALAIANYGINLKRINSAQFAGGGKATANPLRSGKITVEQNIPTQTNGDNILATVKKGEVILNEEQQARIGGPSVFKSAGVPGFAGGGMIDDKKYSTYASGGFTGLNYPGSLGSNLLAPFNPNEFLNPKNGGSSADITELKSMVGALTENIGEVSRSVHERIDNLRVVNDPVEAARVSDKVKKLKSIGKLR